MATIAIKSKMFFLCEGSSPSLASDKSLAYDVVKATVTRFGLLGQIG